MFTKNFNLASYPPGSQEVDALAARVSAVLKQRVFYCFGPGAIVPARNLAEARTILQHRYETDSDRPYFFGAKKL